MVWMMILPSILSHARVLDIFTGCNNMRGFCQESKIDSTWIPSNKSEHAKRSIVRFLSFFRVCMGYTGYKRCLFFGSIGLGALPTSSRHQIWAGLSRHSWSYSSDEVSFLSKFNSALSECNLATYQIVSRKMSTNFSSRSYLQLIAIETKDSYSFLNRINNLLQISVS